MDNLFIISGIIISIIYLLIRFIEMRFIEKENKPLKYLIRDTLLVYFSVIIGFFLMDQLKPIIQNGGNIIPATTQVFVDNPDF